MAKKSAIGKATKEFLASYREALGDTEFSSEQWETVFDEKGKPVIPFAEMSDEHLLVVAMWDALAREREARLLLLDAVQQLEQRTPNRATRRAANKSR